MKDNNQFRLSWVLFNLLPCSLCTPPTPIDCAQYFQLQSFHEGRQGRNAPVHTATLPQCWRRHNQHPNADANQNNCPLINSSHETGTKSSLFYAVWGGWGTRMLKRRSAMERRSPRLSNSDGGERGMGKWHGYRLILTSKWRKRFFPSAWKKSLQKRKTKHLI